MFATVDCPLHIIQLLLPAAPLSAVDMMKGIGRELLAHVWCVSMEVSHCAMSLTSSTKCFYGCIHNSYVW